MAVPNHRAPEVTAAATLMLTSQIENVNRITEATNAIVTAHSKLFGPLPGEVSEIPKGMAAAELVIRSPVSSHGPVALFLSFLITLTTTISTLVGSESTENHNKCPVCKIQSKGNS